VSVVRRAGENKGGNVSILGVAEGLPWDLYYQRGIFSVHFPGALRNFLIPQCWQRGEGGRVYEGINGLRFDMGVKAKE
jgi:hypothetical protein